MSKDIPADRWSEIDRVFEAALEVPDSERTAWLKHACAGDAELLETVTRLLKAEEGSRAFLERPPGLPDGASDDDARMGDGLQPVMPERIGRYRLVEEIGRGGWGTVYRAERDAGDFVLSVAIKLLRRGLDTDDVLTRFRAEQQILANLNHPNIARLMDGGAAEDGRPYLVMELIEGVPITMFCEERDLPLAERLRLFASVGRTVQYAHRNLVVHRDLKPSNILVTGDGEVKLLDFGIAKLIDDAEHGFETPVTRTGFRPMTPEYASPEQVTGDVITTASDVYQLGLLLYELLTGSRPRAITGGSRWRVADRLTRTAPPPSDAVLQPSESGSTSGADSPGLQSHRLSRQLRGDLDVITLKAVHEDPERRYASVADLVDDVERYLSGRPVRARPDTFGYRARKLVRRRPGTVAAGIAAFLAGGIYTGTLQLHADRVARERDRAESALARAQLETSKAEQVTAFLTRLLETADPAQARGASLTVREVLDRGVEDRDGLPEDPEVRAELLGVMAGVYQSLGLWDPALSLREEALALQRDVYGNRHLSVIHSLTAVGRVLFQQGDYPGSERALSEAIATGRELPGEADLAVAEALAALATTHSRAGRTAAATAAAREALDIRATLTTSDPDEQARSLRMLANVLGTSRDFEGAVAANRQSVAILRSAYGDHHPSLGRALGHLARNEWNAGNMDAAEDAFREAIAVFRTVAADHRDQVGIMNNLAMLLRVRRSYDASEQLFREVLDLQRRVSGPDHPETAWVQSNLARTLVAKGAYDEAERHFDESLALLRRVAGPDAPNMWAMIREIAELHAARGELQRAEALHRDALARLQASQGEDSSQAPELLNLLGSVLRRQGRLDEAEAMHREALAVARRGTVPEIEGDYRIRSSLIGIGLVRRDAGDLAGAEAHLREALEMQVRALGENHPSVGDTREYLDGVVAARETQSPGS